MRCEPPSRFWRGMKKYQIIYVCSYMLIRYQFVCLSEWGMFEVQLISRTDGLVRRTSITRSGHEAYVGGILD